MKFYSYKIREYYLKWEGNDLPFCDMIDNDYYIETNWEMVLLYNQFFCPRDLRVAESLNEIFN